MKIVGFEIGNQLIGVMGGDVIMEEAMKYAEPTPKMIPLNVGHWIDINGIYANCSCCGKEIYQTGNFRYCPYCNVKMAESEEQ